MPSFKTAFGSFLKHEDLQGGEPRVVIASVTQEEVKGENGMEKKLVARFVGKDKAMILNLTNCEALSHIAGTDDYDEWAGVRVQLYTDTNVKFGSKTVSGLRIKAVAAKAPVAPPPPPPPVAAEPPVPVYEDEIPFTWLMPLVLPALGLLGSLGLVA